MSNFDRPIKGAVWKKQNEAAVRRSRLAVAAAAQRKREERQRLKDELEAFTRGLDESRARTIERFRREL